MTVSSAMGKVAEERHIKPVGQNLGLLIPLSLLNCIYEKEIYVQCFLQNLDLSKTDSTDQLKCWLHTAECLHQLEVRSKPISSCI